VKRREAKREAARVAAGLIGLAVSTARTNPTLARGQTALARRIMLKFNVRYDWSLRRFFCRGCKGLLLPGLNARVRTGPQKFLLVTCEDCGRVNRKRLSATRTLK
jgi:RNase P subunit RPR2